MNNLLDMINKSYFNYDYNIILEPLTCIIRLILLNYKEKGTKISIDNNSINYDYPNQFQGIIRNFKGDSREHLHNIYNPLEKSFVWYNKDDEKYEFLYTKCISGLNKLRDTYDKKSTIHHTLQHFIDIINNNLQDKKIDNNIHSNDYTLSDEIKNYWKESEINIIYITLKYIDTCKDNDEKEIYIDTINTILNYKEKKVQEYIKKSSTSYM